MNDEERLFDVEPEVITCGIPPVASLPDVRLAYVHDCFYISESALVCRVALDRCQEEIDDPATEQADVLWEDWDTHKYIPGSRESPMIGKLYWVSLRDENSVVYAAAPAIEDGLCF
ncbi:MAG: hypothetical protein ACK5ZS_00155 [bacterium]